jgi:hypothetical protein
MVYNIYHVYICHIFAAMFSYESLHTCHLFAAIFSYESSHTCHLFAAMLSLYQCWKIRNFARLLPCYKSIHAFLNDCLTFADMFRGYSYSVMLIQYFLSNNYSVFSLFSLWMDLRVTDHIRKRGGGGGGWRRYDSLSFTNAASIGWMWTTDKKAPPYHTSMIRGDELSTSFVLVASCIFGGAFEIFHYSLVAARIVAHMSPVFLCSSDLWNLCYIFSVYYRYMMSC